LLEPLALGVGHLEVEDVDLVLEVLQVVESLGELHFDPAAHRLRQLFLVLSDDVRQLAYQYHQTTVEDLGFVVALQRYINDFVKRTGIKARFTKSRTNTRIPLRVATSLYRIAQEALGNVGLHAKASEATVELLLTPDTLSLTIHDNGIGMNLEQIRSRAMGLGMLSMQERVRLLNGTLEWHSTPGEGTRIIARLPWPTDQP